METKRFSLYCGNTKVADYMTIDIATLLIEAFYNKYNKDDCKLTIVPEEKCSNNIKE